MAENGKQTDEGSVITKLSKRGEEAVNRLMEELGRNERVTDAMARALSAKDKLDETTRRTLAQVGVAAADEIKDLRGRLERLEKRLAALEKEPAKPAGGTKKATGAKTTRKPSTATAKKTATRSSTAKKKKPSGSSSGSGSSGSSS
jgi:polyhydroxyalkanoate synthesis regulator phasin